MTIITENHYKKWIVVRESMRGEDINWLENDLILYANEYAPTGVGLQPKFKEILSRFCNVTKVKSINFHNYVYSNTLSPKSRLNILWGLFTIEERGEFMNSAF
jgi:hypothetical protein